MASGCSSFTAADQSMPSPTASSATPVKSVATPSEICRRAIEQMEAENATLNAYTPGSGINDRYEQVSDSYALFTHNIFSFTERLDGILGLAVLLGDQAELEERGVERPAGLALAGERPLDAVRGDDALVEEELGELAGHDDPVRPVLGPARRTGRPTTRPCTATPRRSRTPPPRPSPRGVPPTPRSKSTATPAR